MDKKSREKATHCQSPTLYGHTFEANCAIKKMDLESSSTCPYWCFPHPMLAEVDRLKVVVRVLENFMEQSCRNSQASPQA